MSEEQVTVRTVYEDHKHISVKDLKKLLEQDAPDNWIWCLEPDAKIERYLVNREGHIKATTGKYVWVPDKEKE